MVKRIVSTRVRDVGWRGIMPGAVEESVAQLQQLHTLHADDLRIEDVVGWKDGVAIHAPVSRPEELPDYQFPMSVAPEFVHPMMQDLLASRLGQRIPMHVIEHDFLFSPESTTPHPLPTTYCTSMEWQGKRVAGPMFISIGHPIIRTDTIPFELRRQLVREMIEEALAASSGGQPYFDGGIVMAIPTLKPGGATHQLFTDPQGLAATSFILPESPGMTYYCFGAARGHITEQSHPAHMAALVSAHGQNFETVIKARETWKRPDGNPMWDLDSDRRAYALFR